MERKEVFKKLNSLSREMNKDVKRGPKKCCKEEGPKESHECGCKHDGPKHHHGHGHDHECGCKHDGPKHHHGHGHDHECGCKHDGPKHHHGHGHECGCKHDESERSHRHDHECGCKKDGPKHHHGKKHRFIPLNALHLLSLISENENLNQRTLAKHLNISPQAVSDTVKKFENDGFILRSEGSSNNENILKLTPLGSSVVEEFENRLADESTKLLGCLSDDELMQLDTILSKISDNLK